MLPPGFEGVDVPDKKTGVVEQYIAVSTREAVASLAQMSVLEVHPWGSKADDLEHPDRLVIDLDPDESLAWSVLAGAADEVRARLKKLGLESLVKTTGGKGLHVVLPIEPEMDWAGVKAVLHRFCGCDGAGESEAVSDEDDQGGADREDLPGLPAE